VLRALTRLLHRSTPAAASQLTLDLAPPRPRTAEELFAALRALGLAGIDRCRLTRNRTVMVSYRGGELRVHEGYLDAPPAVMRAIVAFVTARTRAQRQAAQQLILGHKIARAPVADRGTRVRACERTRPEDEPLARTLAEWHERFNAHHFDGRLRTIPVRVSRRLRSRLGHYTAATPVGDPAEIVIGYRHIRRHGWEEALHTLLHEMVHQWQDEAGHAIDHGATFRAKARDVGVTPAARRAVAPRSPRAGVEHDGAGHGAIGLRAARGDVREGRRGAGGERR
jgi:hypothetical protein